ncbi:RNA polymerase sigma factor [Prevotella sp. AGR2160]|uniref:RNA polymerase sigma factor n=1 Tax=Prevotella sp. AGR2160 TaxID=1280674 RepID=UPI00056423A9|nr:RNA polymerase sigma factor [Prevotella sp. AGR2160]
MAQDIEQSIIDRFRRGDSSAMDVLYSQYSGYLTAVCARYITDDDDLKDVLQEALIKIFTNIGNFEYRGRGTLKGWMSRIVVNEALSLLRRQSAAQKVRPDTDLPDLPDEEPQLEGITTETIINCIQQLPPGYRTVFNLYAIEGHSHQEIAQMLGIKADTSASQYYKAKNMLARMLREVKRQQNQ